MIALYPTIDGFTFDQNNLSTLTAVRYDRWFAGSHLNGYSRKPKFRIIEDAEGRKLLAVSIDSLIDDEQLCAFWKPHEGVLVYSHGDFIAPKNVQRRKITLDTAIAACNGGSTVDLNWNDRGLSRAFSGVKIWGTPDGIGFTGSPITTELLREGFRGAWIYA